MSRPFRDLMLFFAAFPFLSGCRESAKVLRSTVVRDSAGVMVVENREPAWNESEHWRVASEPTVSIGAVSSSDPVYEFSMIMGLTRLADGRIVVLEGQGSELRWYSEEGTFEFSRGGEGPGPGEFTRARRLHRMPGDTLAVEGRPQFGLVLFSPYGEYIGEFAMDIRKVMDAGPLTECASQSLPDGSWIMCVNESGAPERRSNPGPGHLRRYGRLVHVSRSSETVVPLGLFGGLEQWGVEYDGRTRFAIHPFHSLTVVAAGGDPMTIAVAINPAYSIEVWSPAGRHLRIIRRPHVDLAPTPAEQDSARQQLLRSNVDQALANRFAAEIETPDSIPAIAGMIIDQTNHLWVAHARGLFFASTAEMNVFDPAGVFLGTVELPSDFGPVEIGEDYLLGTRRDENGVPFVELYALEKNR